MCLFFGSHALVRIREPISPSELIVDLMEETQFFKDLLNTPHKSLLAQIGIFFFNFCNICEQGF